MTNKKDSHLKKNPSTFLAELPRFFFDVANLWVRNSSGIRGRVVDSKFSLFGG